MTATASPGSVSRSSSAEEKDRSASSRAPEPKGNALPFRKLFFWLHLTAALLSGLVILAMSVTGILLAFQRQIIAFAERDVRIAGEGTRALLPPSVLIDSAKKVMPDADVSNVTLRSATSMPLIVGFGRNGLVFVNPYTGEVAGKSNASVRHFFETTENLHRSLALDEPGAMITGASNLIFFFIVLSGMYLWIPRQKTIAAVRVLTRFRRGLRGRSREFSWHNAAGFWACIPLLVIVFSGVVFSYEWGTSLVYRIFGGEAPSQQGGGPGGGGPKRRLNSAELDRLWAVALAETAHVSPRWKSFGVRLPLPPEGPVSFSIDEGTGARPDKRSQLMIDRKTATVVEQKKYSAQSGGQKARGWLRWLHTGEAGGIVGQVIATLATIAAVLLVWTGFSLALRRFSTWLRRRQPQI